MIEQGNVNVSQPRNNWRKTNTAVMDSLLIINAKYE